MSTFHLRAGRLLRTLAAFSSVVCGASTWAAPPAAPQVTVGASEIKQLRFDWNIVPRSNYYELWAKADNGSPYVKYSESKPWQPHVVHNISAHLVDWNQSRYIVKACNPSGCTASAPIAVKDVLPDTVGFVKSTFSSTYSEFGAAVDVSEDGSTMVALTDNERIFAPGFYPEREGSFAIYLYRQANHHWIEEARLLPSNIAEGTGYNAVVSLSADGNVLAVGVPNDTVTDPDSSAVTSSGGAVYVFRRSGATWHQEARIVPCNCLADQEQFGSQVGLDDAGTTLAISRKSGGGAGSSGSVQIRQFQGHTWTQTASIPALAGDTCRRSALGGDGQTLVRNCGRANAVAHLQVYSVPGWQLRATLPFDSADTIPLAVAIDSDGSTIAGSWLTHPNTNEHSNAVAVYRRSSTNYTLESRFAPGAWTHYTYYFGESLALSHDGALLAIGDEQDSGLPGGVMRPPLVSTSNMYGAVYIEERKAAGWNLRRVVKLNDPQTLDATGNVVAFGLNGNLLAVGAPTESSGAREIGGPVDYESPASGAVWLY